MRYRRIGNSVKLIGAILCLAVTITACNTTKYIKDGDYLLRSNSISLKSDKVITQKGELKDNLAKLIVQKPNSYTAGIPFKLLLYNFRYKKYQQDTTNFQLKSKTVERPVIYDSATLRKSAQNLKSYLFSQGYFYAKISDTTTFKNKKAYVTFKIETGLNYLINNVYMIMPDSSISGIVKSDFDKETNLQKGAEYNFSLLENERSRISTLVRDNGYYYFSNDNITFELDTMNKQFFRDAENPFESAINFIALQKQQKKPTLDIKMTIDDNEDPKSLYRYGVSRVRVFPDFESNRDFRDSMMTSKTVKNIQFKYHRHYINERVVVDHLFIGPDRYFSQSDNDKTISNLSDLGVFQSVRTTYREDTSRGGRWLSSNIFMTPNKKFDFVPTIEATTGSTYAAGTALTLTMRNRNFARGANLLTNSITGAVDYYYDTSGGNFFQHFKVLTKSLNASTSLAFPKFLIPFYIKGISSANLPRTVISLSANLLDRVSYFTLINTNSSFSYRWRETKTKSWEVTPIFVSTINLPYKSDTFKSRLANNEYLKNSYNDAFVEGENVTFTFTNKEVKKGDDYSYIKVGLEEAGGLMSGISSLLNKGNSQFARYVKFDFDAQHFVIQRHSTIALRFYGGVGIPYGQSRALPYIKQYYVGGAYSIRGWRVRSLGPGSYYSPTKTQSVIDRTGDIKLEANAEYRFDIIKLFSGAIKLNGALFVDAGNIWLAKQDDSSYANGEFPQKFSQAYKIIEDLAISPGVGIRMDIAGFILLRFDVAFPIKNPDYPVDGGWVIDKIDIQSPDWKKKNLQLNFGIGYPF